ncbi:MRN complex-interacting protein isoform X3 [Odontomachus brunneus]|uniref:MRN complex-interacting protein isoform X3 n=1 Tax=Odontomachus brunneus TaxID=486640 RepID=UPI0013F2519E|nr:MRN complex-interacting protein isoform X3 [Odontomachus brunneus]
MSQEMNILCCYSCKMYQVHIVKKARKWQCKLCGEKQSVKQIYFQGSGKDCRLHVQRLNSLKTNELFSAVVSEQDVSNTHYNTSLNVSEMSGSDKVIESKWTKYLDSPKKKQPSDTEDSSSEDICQTENVISGNFSPTFIRQESFTQRKYGEKSDEILRSLSSLLLSKTSSNIGFSI